jgi:DNA-binding transcriptional LysR family regulator
MGLISGTLRGTVASQIADYISQNDRIRFLITEGSSEELMDLVREEKLDMAIVDTTNRDRSLHFRKLCQHSFYAALPADHPLAGSQVLLPQQLSHEPQVVFNNDVENIFGQWASGAAAEEHIVCTVNTSQAALDLVAAGVGVCLLSDQCVTQREGVSFVPIKNWYQAQYMCILYDKWLEPLIWGFVEKLVKVIRSQQNPE